MDSAERKLIDLYNLLSQYQRTGDQSLVGNIQTVRAEISNMLNGATDGNDNININIDGDNCPDECPPGPQGVQGIQGIQGVQGIQATEGTQGTGGIQGIQGIQGVQGIQGIQATEGTQGTGGIQGIQGIQGPPGPPGLVPLVPCTCKCKSVLVSSDYTATCDDYYIGVNSNEPVTISLPANCTDCCEIIVKAEMGPPLGNRKVTVTTTDGSYIDGTDKYVMEVPYQSVNLFCRGGDWNII